jgi:hypothetical protein
MTRSSVGPVPLKAPPKAAHVNMMTDAIIINLPTEALRSILRGLLGVDSNVTKTFHHLAADYLAKTEPESIPPLFTSQYPSSPTPALAQLQSRYRCLMGCGYGFACLESICEVVEQIQRLPWGSDRGQETLMQALSVVDADLVQAVTAVQKELLTGQGFREMSKEEFEIVVLLYGLLSKGNGIALARGREFAFQRGLSRLEKLNGVRELVKDAPSVPIIVDSFSLNPSAVGDLETFQLGNSEVPRMFMGLWQFSSPAWGTASRSKINADFRKHVDAGFTAYGK